jgi:hypothetical protein
MSNGNDDQGKPSGAGGSGMANNPGSVPPKKPMAVIDLEAKEVEIRDLKKPDLNKPADPKLDATLKTGMGTVPPITPKATDAKPDTTKPEAVKPEVKPAAATSTSSASKPSAAAPAKSNTGSSLGRLISHLGAGALGAVLALFGADQITSKLGVTLPTVGASQIADLNARVATLDQRLAETQGDMASSDVRERLRQVQSQFDALKQSADETSQKLVAVTTAQQNLSDLAAQSDKKIADALGQAPADRLAKLEQTFASLSEAGAAGDTGKLPQLAGLISRLDALEATLDSRLEVVQRSVADGLQKQQVRLEERLASVDKPVELETVKASTKQLAEEVVGVKANAEKLAQDIQQSQVSGTQIRQELAALKQQTTNIDAAMKGEFDKVVKADELGTVTATLGKLQSDLSTVVSKEQVREASANRIVLALELANLKRAMERGGSFERELEQVKAVAPVDLDLKALADSAKAGLPTQAVLAREFRDTARAVVAAEAAPAEDGTLLDRLVAGASSVVQVRRVGNVEGQTAEAIVARMEKRIADGDLEGTVKEAEGLTGGAKEAARGWLDKLNARLAVDRAMLAVDEGLRKVLSSAQP